MTAAESHLTEALDELDEFDALRAAYDQPPFGEDRDDRDPIKAMTIPAGWGIARIERYLRRLMRNPGEYTVSFTGRITPQRVDKFIAAVNDNCGAWEGGAGVEWEDDHAGVPRPTIFLNSLHHGPYASEEGETLPWGGLYTQPDSSKGPRVPETNRSATAPRPGIPVFPGPAELEARQRLAD